MRAPRCSGPRRAPARVRSADVARGLPSSEPLADAVVAREHVYARSRERALDGAGAEGRDEIVAAGEVGHLDVRPAHFGRPVRVASGGAGEVALRRVDGGAAVVAGERLARVEHLDRVDLRPEPIERLSPQVIPAVPAERMRHDDHAALLAYPGDRLLAGEVARDLALEEEPDQLAVARADLLADDDAEALSHLAQPERAGDDVVVGRADDVEARRTDRPGLFRERRAAVGRVLRMRVHVDADASVVFVQGLPLR